MVEESDVQYDMIFIIKNAYFTNNLGEMYLIPTVLPYTTEERTDSYFRLLRFILGIHKVAPLGLMDITCAYGRGRNSFFLNS